MLPGAAGPSTEVEKIYNAINAARAAGDTARVEVLTQALNKLLDSSGMTVEGFGPNGELLTRVRTGGGGSTYTERTRIGEQARKGEEALNLLTSLEASLSPGAVGVPGKLGEVVVDRGLAQLFPQLADRERMQARDLIRLTREQLLRQVSGDSRFSNTDREQIERALPSEGPMESYESAMSKIRNVRAMIQDRLEINQRHLEDGPKALPAAAVLPPKEQAALVQRARAGDEQAIQQLREQALSKLRAGPEGGKTRWKYDSGTGALLKQ